MLASYQLRVDGVTVASERDESEEQPEPVLYPESRRMGCGGWCVQVTFSTQRVARDVVVV